MEQFLVDFYKFLGTFDDSIGAYAVREKIIQWFSTNAIEMCRLEIEREQRLQSCLEELALVRQENKRLQRAYDCLSGRIDASVDCVGTVPRWWNR